VRTQRASTHSKACLAPLGQGRWSRRAAYVNPGGQARALASEQPSAGKAVTPFPCCLGGTRAGPKACSRHTDLPRWPSNTNAFSLLDEQAGAASKTRSKKSKNRKKELAESALASVPAEVVPSVDYDDGFQAVPAKGSKARAANPPQGATDVHSAAQAVERAACAAATAGDLTALWRGWVQQARPP